ncbi:DMT family transporter [Massilia sp. PAMC28688]|uniref:DMT family transporter n=1 Tax=Massilia sp. PAMC28688 TaxID=2861283 RepID=UPI001C6370EE|nr:DMT family transporter [Massilia sp. PAMC28688]QYF95909.1 DMT family transporter [Massilia sp. PAMC28688]
MLLAVAMFSLMDAVMKQLSGHYPSMQVASLRALTSLPLVLLYIWWRGAFKTIFKVRWALHVWRAVLGVFMLALFTFGIRNLSLAEAYTIFFISPALITMLSVVFLKEQVSSTRWIAIGVGLIGVLVVLRPTGEGMFTLGGLAILTAASFYAISAIMARVLGRTDSGDQMVLWLMAMVALGATVLAAPNWVTIRGQDIWLLSALAATGFIGQLAITEAFSRGEPSSVAPLEYTALAWAVALDWLIWSTLPDYYTLVGAAIIIGSGVYLIRSEKSRPLAA